MSDGDIFISYRRGPDSDAAARLHNLLERHFDREKLFMDVDAIPLGEDFVAYLDRQVSGCDALLAVIGPGWIEAIPRLHDPADFVRIELESALKRPDIPVIPVLVNNARMPAAADLPESLRALIRAKRHRPAARALLDGCRR